jgi:hypothetical protein
MRCSFHSSARRVNDSRPAAQHQRQTSQQLQESRCQRTLRARAHPDRREFQRVRQIENRTVRRTELERLRAACSRYPATGRLGIADRDCRSPCGLPRQTGKMWDCRSLTCCFYAAFSLVRSTGFINRFTSFLSYRRRTRATRASRISASRSCTAMMKAV